MKIAIVGAGLLGLFTARRLQAEGGHEIHVFERREGPGLETSFANGAILHPSAVEPWNTPGIGRFLLSNLGNAEAAVLVRARALPSLIGWGWRFLRESNPARWREHTFHNVALALRSVALMREVRNEGIDYGAAPLGTLSVYRDAVALEAAAAWAAELATHGVPWRRLGRDEVLALEPALRAGAAGHADGAGRHRLGAIVGGIHATGDESGDAQRLCRLLQPQLSARGVHFHFNTGVRRLHLDAASGGTRVAGLWLAGPHADAEGELHRFDAVVLAAGPWSGALAAGAGLRLPVRPAKGYSVTFELPAPLARSEDMAVVASAAQTAQVAPVARVAQVAQAAPDSALQVPARPVIDAALHIAVVPVVGGRLRVAGTAEFCGFDATVDATRVANLLRQLARLFPRVAEASAAWPRRDWAGLRPLCADGSPLIGPTRVPGLWLNTGHGQLGWTTAAASAELFADVMAGRAPAVSAAPFAPARFGL